MILRGILFTCGISLLLLGSETNGSNRVFKSETEQFSQSISRMIPKMSQVARGLPALDSFIVAIMDSNEVPGLSCAVNKDDSTIWTGSYGFANIESEIEASDTTVYLLASISKTVTSVALMQLWERGYFDLDDNVSDYLSFEVANPRFPDSIITFRMLVAHVSSIRDNWGFLFALTVYGSDSPVSLSTFVQNYLTPGGAYYNYYNYTTSPPATAYQYTNTAFALAGHLVKSISGESFAQYCQDSIFDPLGMSRSSWFIAGLEPDNIAVPYAYEDSVLVPVEHYHAPFYPAAFLRASSIDLAHHLLAFMNGGLTNGVRILYESTVDSMMSIQYPEVEYEDSLCWGLGWYRDQSTVRTLWGHKGGYNGVRTGMFFEPEQNIGVVVLSNGSSRSATDTVTAALFWFFEDADSDGVVNGEDNCLFAANLLQSDYDSDGVGDSCDNCIHVQNPDQYDSDSDNAGDSCDNCIDEYNPDQSDSDGDGEGDACDYVCGDADSSGEIDIDDVVFLIMYIFAGGSPPNPYVAGDADCSGGIDIDDAVYLISFIFSGGEEPCTFCP
jgi:CubicO group peptidase (beta-lactamase class C family)